MVWAPSMDCTRGKSASVVECTLIDEAPEADRICLSVIANEKISTRCATKQNISQITDVTHDNARREAHHCPQNLSRGIVSTGNRQLIMRFINFGYDLTMLTMPSSFGAVSRLYLRRNNDVGARRPVPPFIASFIATFIASCLR